MKRDSQVFDLISEERNRQMHGIELIPSENFVSDEVMEAMGSVLTNKYAEGYPAARYYGGCQVVDKVENLAIERVCKLYGAEYANVQPHSGAQANMAVFFAVLKPGDTFMGLDLAHGGHLSHGSPVNMSGTYFKAIGYQLDPKTERVDYDDMERKALEHKPKLIVGGASAYSREWDYKRMREIADKVGAILLIDMAHTAGLIAAGLLENPVKYAHIVTSTTHKTLRGPRGGIILMGKDFENPWGLKTPKGVTKMMSQILNSAVFPGIQGGPLEHVIAAKAVAFGEALDPSYKEYQKQVQKNAKAMAEAFTKRGYKIVSEGTDNHLMLVDLRTKFPELTGKLAEKCLVAADITTNKNMVPFDSRSPFQTSGLRFGTPAITTRGLKEDKMEEIVALIDRVLSDPENEANIAAVRKEVNAMMANYPLFACTWRIYRDTRFSPDKTPYKTHMGAFVAPRGKKGGYSGYYFHVEPVWDERSWSQGHQLTTGLYCPLPEVLRSVRDEILDNGAEIEAAIREAKGFVLDESNKLKRLPKGYAPGSPYDEWLKLKDVYITERLAPEFMLDKELLKNTLHEFRKTKHFSDILNRAVQFAYDEMI